METLPDNAADPQPTPDDVAQRNEQVRRVRDAVDALPPAMRGPLVLVRLEGMKYREAAQVLGISLAALRMRVHRAHLALAEAQWNADLNTREIVDGIVDALGMKEELYARRPVAERPASGRPDAPWRNEPKAT